MRVDCGCSVTFLHIYDTLNNLGKAKTTSYRYSDAIKKLFYVMMTRRSGVAALSILRGSGGREESTFFVAEALR
jgi:hypothetical protein